MLPCAVSSVNLGCDYLDSCQVLQVPVQMLDNAGVHSKTQMYALSPGWEHKIDRLSFESFVPSLNRANGCAHWAFTVLLAENLKPRDMVACYWRVLAVRIVSHRTRTSILI